MQGFPPHLPGSIVMRGWVVADIPEVYLGADRLVMPIDRQTATTAETSRRLPDDVAPWRETAGVLASLAEMRWCRIVADEAAGQYVVSTLKDDDAPSPPTWPADDFLDVLYAAFHGRLIASEDHPLVPNWN